MKKLFIASIFLLFLVLPNTSFWAYCLDKKEWIWNNDLSKWYRDDFGAWFYSDDWIVCYWYRTMQEVDDFWKRKFQQKSIEWDYKWTKVEDFNFMWFDEHNRYYVSVFDNIYIGSNLFIWATKNNFEILNGMFLKDINNVYYNEEIINWVNVKSFKALNQLWWYDNKNLYIWKKIFSNNIDYKTIQLIDYLTIIDKNFIYLWDDELILTHKEFEEKYYSLSEFEIDFIFKKTNNKNSKSKFSMIKQAIISKNKLYKTKNWDRYINQIDIIIKKTSENKLEKLSTKLSKFDTSLKKYLKYKDILDYLEAKVYLELKSREER